MTVLSLQRREKHAALRLVPLASELGRAREFADAAAARFGLTGRDRDGFKLAASEVVANAIEHGLPCGDGTIHLWTYEREGRLVFGVRNAGEFEFRPPPTDPLADRGRGLILIAELVDSVALSCTPGHVQMELTKESPDGDS
jgi:anti-sigma regulatory factor (Ser/Thr protein kinase)